MKPVNESAFDTRSFAAGGEIAFGALCDRSGDGIVKAIITGDIYDYVGVAPDDVVEKDVDGFYSQYDSVPLITAGVVRLWLLGGGTGEAGEYVRPAAALGGATEFLGVVAQDTNRTHYSVGRIVGDDVGHANFDQLLVSNAASGQKTLTLDATKIGALACAVGDYIVIDDDNGAEINRVAAIGTATLTCQKNLTNAYTTAATGTVYKLTQVEVLLL